MTCDDDEVLYVVSTFKLGNFDFSHLYRSRRKTTSDNDMIRAEVKTDPCLTIEELPYTLKQPRTAIQKHFQQFEKRQNTEAFVIRKSLEMIKRFFMINKNVKGRDSIRIIPQEVQLGKVYSQGRSSGNNKIANVVMKYPVQIIFVCLYELLERYAFYSIRTILVLYFSDVLKMTEDEATVYFHSFIIIAYLLPLFGGWIADSWFGKFRTIMYLSYVYVAGAIILTISSLAPQLSLPGKPVCLFGMVLIAIGTGTLKPCVVPFGADQFTLPEQQHELDDFFSLFYWCINVGSVVACFASPFIRSNVHCFGNNHCYPLAFATSTCTIILALTIITIGKKWYTIKEANHNVVSQFFYCLGYGLWRKLKSHHDRSHWLDHADDKFPQELIEDSKIIIRIFTVILPAIVFWALNDKQSSRWTFQARKLNGQIVEWFKIEPDQMTVLSSLLVLVAVPLFQKIIYPVMGKVGLCKSLLCRMSLGGFLMCLTFLIAALLQSQIEVYRNEFELSIAWQLPQYIVLVCAEILFVISGTNFAYTQSPVNMKSLVASLWFLTVSIGNIVACIVVGIGIKNLVLEFIIDSSIMAFFMIVFSFLAYRFYRSDMILLNGIAAESQQTITSKY